MKIVLRAKGIALIDVDNHMSLWCSYEKGDFFFCHRIKIYNIYAYLLVRANIVRLGGTPRSRLSPHLLNTTQERARAGSNMKDDKLSNFFFLSPPASLGAIGARSAWISEEPQSVNHNLASRSWNEGWHQLWILSQFSLKELWQFKNNSFRSLLEG